MTLMAVYTVAVTLAVSLALATVVLLVKLRGLRQRVDKVRRVVERMAAGNLAARALLSGDDATARLADAVNAFAEQVQQSREGWMQRELAQKRLLTSISHDLRTPITSISGYVRALREGIVKEQDQERYLDIIHQKTGDLAALVDDLFYLTRLESGDLVLHLECVDLAEVLRQSVLGFALQLEAEGTDVQIHIPERRCLVRANETALRRIFSNLIVNSLRHGSGKTAFGVDLTSESTPMGDCYQVVIWDNGQGFPPGALERIFVCGRRPVEGALSGSAGLGLAIARDLTEKLGGMLTARSVPFQRTAFTLILPRAH